MHAVLRSRSRRASESARALAAALIVAAGSVHVLSAQVAATGTSAVVIPGTRVRITMPGEAPFVGTLLRESADTLVAALPSGASLAVARPRITRLEVSGGVQRRTWQGAGVGLLAGATVGALVGFATYKRSDCGDSAIGQGIVCPLIDGVSREVTVYGDALLIGAAGSIVGALIGHAGHETWIPVSLPRVGALRARLGVERMARNVVIGGALEF